MRPGGCSRLGQCRRGHVETPEGAFQHLVDIGAGRYGLADKATTRLDGHAYDEIDCDIQRMKRHLASITGLLQCITHQRVKHTGAREIVVIVDPAGEPTAGRIMSCSHHGHHSASDRTSCSIWPLVAKKFG